MRLGALFADWGDVGRSGERGFLLEFLLLPPWDTSPIFHHEEGGTDRLVLECFWTVGIEGAGRRNLAMLSLEGTSREGWVVGNLGAEISLPLLDVSLETFHTELGF